MAQGEDRIPLMETPAGQSPSNTITHQPQATPGISRLSVIIKALLSETEQSHGCYCLLCPRQESQQLASALLIGTAKNQGQLAGNQPPRSNPTYISQLKQHLTEQSVEIFRFKPVKIP